MGDCPIFDTEEQVNLVAFQEPFRYAWIGQIDDDAAF